VFLLVFEQSFIEYGVGGVEEVGDETILLDIGYGDLISSRNNLRFSKNKFSINQLTDYI